MAIIVTPAITGQEMTSTATFSYLYEPLLATIYDSSVNATEFYIDTYRLDGVGTKLDIFEKHVSYPTLGDFEIDLMELIRSRTDILSDNPVVSEYDDINGSQVAHLYTVGFDIYTDYAPYGTIQVKKTILYGGRQFKDFTPAISSGNPLTEFDYLNVDVPSFIDFPKYVNTLNTPTSSPIANVSVSIPTSGRDVCGAYLIWKSRFGGYVGYGFDIYQENSNQIYSGDIESEFFYTTNIFGGDPRVRPDYNRVDVSYDVQLKALSVPINEAKALKGLQEAKFAWLMRDKDSKLELMRITSAQLPYNNYANGIDVGVSLKSISVNKHFVI